MKKLVLHFLVAIMLPVVILGCLGYTTFAKRREAVKNLLSSSLWVSAEAALRSIENALLEEEDGALRLENFAGLLDAQRAGNALEKYSFQGLHARGKLFLLDDSLRILVPRTARDSSASGWWPAGMESSPFQNMLSRAEATEFAGKRFGQSAELYRKSAALAVSRREKALALEGLGRSLLHSKKPGEAHKAYSELVSGCGDEENRAGHPFSIIARLQLAEIERLRERDENAASDLFEVYQDLRKGAWSVSRTAYEFFVSEIGSRLGDLGNQTRVAEIVASFENLRRLPSPYLEALDFAALLEGDVIPEIHEKVGALKEAGLVQNRRFAVGSGDKETLISFCKLSGLNDHDNGFGGFYWDPDSLRKRALRQVSEAVCRDSGLSIKFCGEGGLDILTGGQAASSGDFVTLPFDKFPFSWKLSASQPARRDLEREAERRFGQ